MFALAMIHTIRQSRPAHLSVVLLCFLLLSCSSKAQEAKPTTEVAQPTKVWTWDELGWDNLELWTDAAAEWRKGEWRECVSAAGIKINCDDCGAVNVEAKVTVGPDGKVLGIEKVKSGSECRTRTDEQLAPVEDCILQSFKNVVLPQPFWGKVIQTYLDTGPHLGC